MFSVDIDEHSKLNSIRKPGAESDDKGKLIKKNQYQAK